MVAPFKLPIDPDENGCWIWPGVRDQWGYGKSNSTSSHRAVWRKLVGPIPEGMELDHLCRVPACVNPEHLEPVTGEENRRRKYASITHCKSGHAYDEANTYIRPGGQRDCRACIRARSAAYAARRRAA